MIEFDVKHRATGETLFTAEIVRDEGAPRTWKLRRAVFWAIKNGANLSGANLRGADLYDADLRGADLRDADLRGADLRDANLRDADLRDANLRDADLSDADLCGARGIAHLIVAGGIRTDGHQFMLTRTEPGPWRVKAGCRNFTLEGADEHWSRTRPVGDLIGDETRMIIAHMVAVAKLRDWPQEGDVL